MNYTENLQKWNKKVEASAGDVTQRIKEMNEKGEMDAVRITELET